MLVVMRTDASKEQIQHVLDTVKFMGLSAHSLPGATRTAIGITGNTGSVDAHPLSILPGVLELIRVTKSYKLTSREMHPDNTIIKMPQGVIGPGTFTVTLRGNRGKTEAHTVELREGETLTITSTLK